jgi:hypothetical protein
MSFSLLFMTTSFTHAAHARIFFSFGEMERISLSLSLSTLGLSLVVFLEKRRGGRRELFCLERRRRGVEGFLRPGCVWERSKKKKRKKRVRGASPQEGARARAKKKKKTHTQPTHTPNF